MKRSTNRRFSGAAQFLITAVLFSCILAPEAGWPAKSAVSDFAGGWSADGKQAPVSRVIIRRSEMILLEHDVTIHGKLTPGQGDSFRYVADFADGKPEGRIEQVALEKKNGKLLFKMGENPVAEYSLLPVYGGGSRIQRKGFSFVTPREWVSNVKLNPDMAGINAEEAVSDILARYYEMGMAKPTEDITIRLVPSPLGEVKADIAKKALNPKLTSRRMDLKIGGKSGYVYENSTVLGKRRISARVYILPWGAEKTLALAATTLLSSFPFDLDAACRAILTSAK